MTIPWIKVQQEAEPVLAPVRDGPRPRVRSRVGVAIVVMALGFLVPSAIGSVAAMTVLLNGIVLGLVALPVAFLLDSLGWVSFGAAAFSGGAAYLFGILCVSGNTAVLPSGAYAVLLATAASLLIGMIFVRSKLLVFTILTLALSQIVLQLVSLNSLSNTTGGSNGLVINYHGSLFGLSPLELTEPGHLWYVAWTVVMLAVIAVLAVRLSRVGRLLRGIRENEPRLQHSGFDTYWPKVLAFGFAGLLGALAGVLQAMSIAFVSTDVLSFGASGTALVAALIGGYRSAYGPIIGGLLLTYGENYFGSTGQLFLYTGIAIIVVLVVFPTGISGVLDWLWRAGERRIRRGATRRRS
jgi:branched-chain amino acid transport system permease protein